MIDQWIKWCIKQHADTNHMYDEYLPYEFHLRMVAKVHEEYKHLGISEVTGWAVWGHDLMEDTRTNYSGVYTQLSYLTGVANAKSISEIIRAVTNDGRGRNRKERMPVVVYEDIRNTPGATMVKLCDRIANVQYSKMTKSRMIDVYRKEHNHFVMMLYHESMELLPMWDELAKLLNND